MAQTAASSRIGGQDAPAGPRHRSEPGPHRVVKILTLGVLFSVLFRGELGSLVRLWWTDPNWSHGFLIPLFSLYFLHQRKQEILRLEYARDPLPDLLRGRRPPPLAPGQTRAEYLGLVLLLLVLAVYAFNVVSPAGYAYLRPISMIAAVGAVVLFLGGWRLLRYTWLPVVFLVFAVPPPGRYYKALAMPLQRLAATIAAALLNLVPHVEATGRGVIIDIVHRGRHLAALNVEEACSGMHLLMAFLALGVAMAYLHERPVWQRIVLLASTVPIAVLCNVIRVTATGFIHVLLGQEYTQGVYHSALGLAMLPLAFAFYGAMAWFMASLFVEEDEQAGTKVVVRKRLGHE